MKKKVYEFISKKNNDEIVERKKCNLSWKYFAIFQGDIDLLKKISPIIWKEKFTYPTPKTDSTIRMIKRMMFRNERLLYSSKSIISGKNIPTIYHPSTWIKSITWEEWENIDTVEYWQKYNFNNRFLDQFKEIFYKVPKLWLLNINNENGIYDNFSSWNKNTFLNADIMNSDNVSYSTTIKNVTNWYDLLQVNNSNYVYNCICSNNLNKCINLQYSSNCYDCGFSIRCKNCNNCWFCYNLENKSNYLFNKKVRIEDIKEIKKNMQTYNWFIKLENIFKNKILQKTIRPDTRIINSENTIWSTVLNSKNAFICFDSYNIENCRYCLVWEYNNNCMDTTIFNRNSNYVYQAVCGWFLKKSHNCITWRESSNMFFCDFCIWCEYMIWCSGMKNKKYCILNKQYTKDEWLKLAPKIINQTKKEWLRWEFFPSEISPFPYNDTVVMDYFPVQKVIDLKWNLLQPENKEWFWIVKVLEPNKFISDAFINFWWKDNMIIKRRTKNQDINISNNLEIIKSEKLPQNINEINDSICSKIILCSTTWRPYRITKLELNFYRNMQITLPRIHQDLRHKKRILIRPPRFLYFRNSDKSWDETISNYNANVSFKVYTQKEYEQLMYW